MLVLLVCACVLHKTYSQVFRLVDLRMEIIDITMKMYVNCYLSVSGSARIFQPSLFIFPMYGLHKICLVLVLFSHLKTNALSPVVLFLRLVN